MRFSLHQLQATGLDSSSLCEWKQGEKVFLVHSDIVEPLTLLQEDARKEGFNLQIVSAYRDFYRQLSIWNAKASGKRILLDSNGQPLAFDHLTNLEKLFAILRWSAIPGLSRHHWGTDIDIYDAYQMEVEDVQLVPAEVEGNGPCADMHRWLTECIAYNKSYGFYRPYQHDTGGVAPEMWHLSYLSGANCAIKQLDKGAMLALWNEHEIELMDELKANLEVIWPKYVELDDVFQPEWVKKNRF